METRSIWRMQCKWNSWIICVLAAKETLRYSELRSELTNITDAVLLVVFEMSFYGRNFSNTS